MRLGCSTMPNPIPESLIGPSPSISEGRVSSACCQPCTSECVIGRSTRQFDTAVHSTWCVIGKRSTPTVLGEVAGQRSFSVVSRGRFWGLSVMRVSGGRRGS